MRVLLTKKLAQAIDGIDLSTHNVGDLLDLLDHDARLIVAEAWAILDRRASVRTEGGSRTAQSLGVPTSF